MNVSLKRAVSTTAVVLKDDCTDQGGRIDGAGRINDDGHANEGGRTYESAQEHIVTPDANEVSEQR